MCVGGGGGGMGLDRSIGVSWACVWVGLCVLKPVLEVEGEREEKE